MFLSTKNPPHDHHPLPSPSSSSFLHLTTSSSHELAQSHPQSFSIRDYAYSNRKKNKIKDNWPFSPKSLQLLSTHGLTDPLPPFEITASSSSGKQIVSHVLQRGTDLAELGLNQTIATTSHSRIVENELFTSTSVSKSKEEIVLVSATTSKTCGRGGGMVKSKEATTCVGLESIMATSKTCPICKTFSSASNTTLNAHIDQCISADSPVISKPNKARVNHQCLSVDSDVPLVSSKPNKTRGKPRMKVKTMVDIYATAKRCTLEDLDRRNGTNWAVISSYSNRVVADKSDVVSKKRKVPPVGVGPVYVDAKGQKLRIITEFSEKKTSTTTLMRQQREDGSNEKKSSSQGSKENSNGSRKRRLGKKHHRYIKLNSHKTNESEVSECQRGFSGEGSSSTGHRRIYNQRMLAKRGSSLKKLNEKGDKVNASRDQPYDDDDDSWSGGDHVVLRGTALSALNKQKLQSKVSGRSKTMFVSKRVRMSEKEEKSLAGGAHINTIRLKRSLTSIQEDEYPQRKNAREVTDASPRASSMRKLLPPFVANGWIRRLSLPVEQKRARFDLSSEEEEEEEETGKWESEMTLSDDDYVSDDNGEKNEVLHRSNPSTFSGYNDYDDEESSEEEEDNNEGDKTDDTGAEFYQSNATIPSERAMYYSEEVEHVVYEEDDVRFDSEVGKGSLYVEVDNIPIPGPPGSFIPSPRGGMSYDEPLGNSSVITSQQLQSSMDQLDRNSSESPVSAFSHFAAGRLTFPPELSSSLREVLSVDVPLSYSTTPVSFSVPSHSEKMIVDKTTTAPSSFRNNDHESCCCQRKERIISEGFTLDQQPSQLLQRRAAASSSSVPMNLTKSPTRLELDPSQFFNKANVSGAVVPPSPSNSVLRLMGKDLMVMNQGEASLASLTPTPQFLDPPPCAGTGLY